MRAHVISAATLSAIVCLGHSCCALSAEDAFFVRGSAGQSSINASPLDSDTGYAINGGYRWAVGSGGSIGIEAGYTDFGNFSARSSLSNANLDVRGPSVGATARLQLASNWHADARAGYMRADFDAHANYGVSIDETLDVWYAGIGFGYDFNNHLSVGLGYDYYRAREHGLGRSPDLYSVNGEYRF